MKLLFTRALVSTMVVCCLIASQTKAQTDTTIGNKTPKGSGSSYAKVAHALCDTLESERLKANAIYNWITHNIRYDVKAMQQGNLKEEDPGKVFKKRKGMCGGYSLLFAAMCKEAGIKALVIDGYSKDWAFDNGDKFYIPRHAWNAVYIDKKWELVDATWGAGGLSQAPGWLKAKMNKAANNPLQTSGKLKFRFQYDSTHFLTHPLTFRIKHLPSDPNWQLVAVPMPLEIFEAGDAAVKQYNVQYPELAQNTRELYLLSEMDAASRLQVSAERIASYNPRFHIVMAAKYQADAIDTVAVNKDGGTNDPAKALNNVQAKLKRADKAVSEQKKDIANEYRALKAKNKTKNLEANQYIRSLHSDNKRMISQCKSYIRKADSRTLTIKQKGGKAAYKAKDVKADQLAKIETRNISSASPSPMLALLEDSVQQRISRIKTMEAQIAKQQDNISHAKTENRERLDSLAAIIILADSALRQETIGRIGMHDNYDEEVMQWNRLVKTARLQQVDSMQKKYFAAYDSVYKNYEALEKIQLEKSKLYRKNLKDMERYKRSSDNPTFLSRYKPMVSEHDSSMNAYYQTVANHIAYMQNHKELFKALLKLYEHQEKLADYMEKSEEKRKELEEKYIGKKEDFDKKENEKQKEQLKATEKKAEKYLSAAH